MYTKKQAKLSVFADDLKRSNNALNFKLIVNELLSINLVDLRNETAK